MQNVIRLAISQILTMESRLPTQYSIIIYFSNMDTFMQFLLLTYTHTRHLHICLCDIISLQSIFHQPTPLGETVTTGQELELPLCAGQSFGWKFMTVPWETIPDCFVGKNVGSVVVGGWKLMKNSQRWCDVVVFGGWGGAMGIWIRTSLGNGRLFEN